MLRKKELEGYLQMFRRLGKAGFDADAGEWLIRHRGGAEEFMMEHFDLLTPAERRHVYRFLFGMFQRSFKRIVEFRLSAESDAECREELANIYEKHKTALEKPYGLRSKVERLAEFEKDLKNKNALVRCSAAFGVYVFTKKTGVVLPILLKILREQTGNERELAVKILGKVDPLTREAIHELRAIAKDRSDPLQMLAENALNRKSRIPKWIRDMLRLKRV